MRKWECFSLNASNQLKVIVNFNTARVQIYFFLFFFPKFVNKKENKFWYY